MSAPAAPAGHAVSTAAEQALATIERLDPDLRAFVHVDPDAVRRDARRLDAAGESGPLRGLTVGLKDIFDTSDAPTEYGSPIYRSRRPDRDATSVALLRAAGALIVGKTATAELACMHPPATRNPHDHERTPGGSSSGSAAAVAAGMVDAALGTQTAGSISRPASFCGVVGYKPTYGLISRAGVLECAQSLDTVGVLARDVPAAALVAATMAQDPAIAELHGLSSPLHVSVLLPYAWADLDVAVGEAVSGLGGKLASLGATVNEIELPRQLRRATDVHRVIMRHELARSYASLYQRDRGRLSDTLIAMIEEGLAYDTDAYTRALVERRAIAAATASMFDRIGLVIAPASSGEAPRGLGSTGDPACAAPWTMVGVPTVTVPAGTGGEGMPVGVTVIGPVGADRLVLSAAHAAMTV